ncbi:hypothetical protein OHA71_06270 [Streptomyces sp. NBC_00444]|uniref:hypothetical protein n=1 Tax=Streptomyces sp. NBC_00444 TaxID=2975744 RepID=UPI002E1E5919
MTDEKSHPHVGPLTDSQRTRLDFARRDFEYARSEDLAQLGEPGLILLVEKLRNRLDDMLNLIDEVTAEPPTSRA